MSNIQHFFAFFGFVSFGSLLISLVACAIYLIADYYDSKDKIECLEDKYCELYSKSIDLEIRVNRLETKTDNIIKETTVNDN